MTSVSRSGGVVIQKMIVETDQTNRRTVRSLNVARASSSVGPDTAPTPPSSVTGTTTVRDSSDEANCEIHVCLPSQFKCSAANRCIPAIFRCNGQDNCGDGEDERDCPEVTCAPNQFQCATTKRCIPRVWVCDRDNDCMDHSDEPANC
ncbi:low-density lipoprotein receptor-related protein 1-like, partial [Leucoraja erinacea]|uniref:low-density lipoprotein receptor-related protein 1-like n=1 Tax=Leucoraja erinaceus TaxID=7782 RepID=UPI0024580C6B